MTRKMAMHGALIGQVKLLLIDEVHTIGDERGGVLEAVVSRMKAVSVSDDITRRGWPVRVPRCGGCRNGK